MNSIKADLSKLATEFQKLDPRTTTVELAWKMFRDALLASTDIRIPQKRLSGRAQLPWINRTIKRKMREHKHLYHRAKKNQEHWTKHREVRNQIKQLLVDAHNEYVKNLLDTIVNKKPKQFWSYIRNLQDQVGISRLHFDDTIRTDSIGKTEALNHQFR